MGLFDIFKSKKQTSEPETQAAKPETQAVETPRVPDPSEIVEMGGYKFYFAKPEDKTTQGYSINVNMTEKMVKVDVPEGEEGLYISGVYLWEDEGKILGKQGENIVFEVSKRSKAYEEILPFARQKGAITIYNRTGDYGRYYRVHLRFKIVIV